MNLTYGDLTLINTCIKLSMVSFGTPQKNLEVYKFISAIKPLQEFFEIERSKLLQKYGTTSGDGNYTITGPDNIKAYQEDLEKLTGLPVDEKIPSPNLTEEDFSSDNCRYPDDKDLWMNARDIKSVLEISKKLNG